MSEARETPWDPSQPLRADATDEQILARIAELDSSAPVVIAAEDAVLATAREYAAARVAAVTAERDRLHSALKLCHGVLFLAWSFRGYGEVGPLAEPSAVAALNQARAALAAEEARPNG